MHHFHYVGQKLHCESVSLDAIAQLHGTPTYVYSAQTIADNYRRLAGSLAGLDLQICYAMKANSNLAVLRHFANLGAAFDLVSGGELRRVVAAGGDTRSEEHTSELQSRRDLVCRLLLEKKKTISYNRNPL